MPSVAAAVAAAALVLAAAAVALAVVLARRLLRLERACDTLAAGGGAPSFVHAVRQSRRVGEGLRRDLDALTEQVAEVRTGLAGAVRHVGVVRYDAFEEVAGQLSYSVALLDDAGDGVVLSAICSRTDVRSYAKPLTAGASASRLSPEEHEAVRQALAPSTAHSGGVRRLAG